MAFPQKRACRSLAFALALAASASALAASQAASPTAATEPASSLVLLSDVAWSPLNPLRGDEGPKAGALWGSRTDAGPSGFLVKFTDGFSSPPHIHNITYRGVVISGLIHNDDPKADKMWMPPGSFWTQPAGEAHITAAKGPDSVAYIEIDGGPYLVRPAREAVDNGERPINVDKSNLVWRDASDITWIDQRGTPASAGNLEVAFLWGAAKSGQSNGVLVKLPTGVTAELRSKDSTLRAVLIRGQLNYRLAGETETMTLEPGSYCGSEAEMTPKVSCERSRCLVYVRAEGKFDIIATAPEN